MKYVPGQDIYEKSIILVLFSVLTDKKVVQKIDFTDLIWTYFFVHAKLQN